MHAEQAMGAENIVYILIFQKPIVMLFIYANQAVCQALIQKFENLFIDFF